MQLDQSCSKRPAFQETAAALSLSVMLLEFAGAAGPRDPRSLLCLHWSLCLLIPFIIPACDPCARARHQETMARNTSPASCSSNPQPVTDDKGKDKLWREVPGSKACLSLPSGLHSLSLPPLGFLAALFVRSPSTGKSTDRI